MKQESYLEKRMYDLSEFAEYAEIILISLGIFLVPYLMPQILDKVFGVTSFIAINSQYVIGTIVNTSLIMAGINIKGFRKIGGLTSLPSMSAILSGVVFKSASIYMLYMIPAIWIGNFTLIYFYKKLFVGMKINYIFSSIVAILSKVMVIFLGFNLLLAINIIPRASKVAEALLLAMGVNQLITATLGSIIAFGILKTVYRNQSKVN